VPVQATPADEGVDVDKAEGFTALKLHHYVKPRLSVPAVWNGASRLSLCVCVCVCGFVCVVCLRAYTVVLGFMSVSCLLLVEYGQIHTAPYRASVRCSEKRTWIHLVCIPIA